MAGRSDGMVSTRNDTAISGHWLQSTQMQETPPPEMQDMVVLWTRIAKVKDQASCARSQPDMQGTQQMEHYEPQHAASAN